MEWFEWVLLGIVLCGLIVAAFIFGIEITERRFVNQCEDKIVGSLKIDTTDPDGPYIFAEFSKSVDAIFTHKYVILKIGEDLISHD